MKNSSEVDGNLLRNLHKDIISMMKRDIKMIKNGDIVSRSDDEAFKEMVDMFDKHLPDNSKFSAEEKEDIVNDMMFANNNSYSGGNSNIYDESLKNFKDSNITGVGKTAGEKAKTLGAMAVRFMGAIVASATLIVGQTIEGAGNIIGAVPVVGTIARHMPGSSKEHGNPNRVNVIRSLGKLISGISAVGIEQVNEKQIPALKISSILAESVKEIQAPTIVSMKSSHSKDGRGF